jgi:peptidoglycan/LPS O-acetylase OafA/YrhL
MRRWNRSLVTDGRSSVWGNATPSGPSSRGSSAAASGEAEATATGETPLATAAGARALDATGGGPGAIWRDELDGGLPLVDGGAGAVRVAVGAALDGGSARQWLASNAPNKTPNCEQRSRMTPVYSRSAGAASNLEHLPTTSPDAHERFLHTPQLPGLDGLRCLAILPVIWHHATPRLLPGVLGKGAVGVDLFFALSGFLITTLLLRERRATGRVHLAAFYARRGLRIFPLYYLVLAFYALRALQTQASSEVARHFLHALPLHATYTSNWFLNYDVPHPVMFAFSWSLCVEEQFYWIWPGLLAFVKQRALLACLMGGAVVLDTLAEHAALSSVLPPGSLGLRVLTSFATPIGCGSLLALLLDTRRGFATAHVLLGWRWSAPLLLALSAYWLTIPATPYLSLSLTLAALVGAVALRGDNGLAWLLERAAVRRVGVLSYALYLLHITALGLVRRFLPALQDSALWVFALGLPLSLVFAEVAHRLVEVPCLRWRARFHAPKPNAG